MGSLVAIWRIVLRRAISNWKMLGILAVGVLVASTLLASAPIYARTMNDLGLTYTIREDIPSGPGTSVTVRGLPIGDEAAGLRESIAGRVDERLGWFSDDTRVFHRLGALAVTPAGESPTGGSRGGLLQEMEGYDLRTEVLEGRFPESTPPGEPVEVALHPEAAATANLDLGDTFHLHERLDDCEQRVIYGQEPMISPCPRNTPSVQLDYVIEAEVVGFVQPADGEDTFWLTGVNSYWGVIRELPATTPWVPMWTAPGTLSEDFATRFPGYAVDTTWNVFANDTAINRANFMRVRDDILALRQELGPVDGLIQSPLVLLLERVARDEDFEQTPLLVLLLQISAIALFYVALVSSIVVERQASEIALLRSRGASMRQILTVYLFEGLLIGVPILLLAPLLAAAATALLGFLPVFDAVSDGSLLPVTIVPTAFAMAAAGVVLSLLALVVPAFVVARRSAVVQRRVEARPGRSFFQRYYLDLMLAGFAALLLWELNERGSAFEPSPAGGLTSDPVLLASPALTIVAAAALILRFYPLLLRGVARLVTPSAGVSLAGALWQVVRSPGQYTRLTLLVMMAIAVGTFAASYSSTADRSYRDRADFEAGVDLRLNETDRSGPRVFDDIEATIHDLPGVEQATLAHRTEVQTGTSGSQSRPVQLLAVDPAAAGDMLYTRDDFASESIASLLFRIRSASTLSGIPLPDDTDRLSIWFNTPEPRPDITAWARVADASGRYTLAEFGKLEETGWQQLETPLQSETAIRMEAPLTFHGIIFTEPSNRFNSIEEPLYLAGLEAVSTGGESTMVDPLDGSRSWSTLPSLDENRDEFSFSPEAAREGEQGGEFSFRTGVQDERRGIYPTDGSVPLVALASTAYLERTGTSVGSQVHLRLGGLLVPTRIVGSYDLFPTLSALDGPSIVYNRDQLASWVNTFNTSAAARIEARELWLSLAEGAQAGDVIGDIQAGSMRVQVIADREQELSRIERNPLVAAGGSGILQLSFIAVLVLVAAALLLSLWMAVQRRRTEFAVMRAMGISRAQILWQLAIEYALVAVLGIAVGAYLGTLVGRRMLSFLDVTASGDPVEPGFILQTDWGFVWLGAAAVVCVFAVALVIAVRILGRTADAQALRSE